MQVINNDGYLCLLYLLRLFCSASSAIFVFFFLLFDILLDVLVKIKRRMCVKEL